VAFDTVNIGIKPHEFASKKFVAVKQCWVWLVCVFWQIYTTC